MMTNEQTHKPSDAHEIQHHIPSVKVAHASRPLTVNPPTPASIPLAQAPTPTPGAW